MEKETCTSKKLIKFLEEIKERYDTGGVWISEKMGRRWSFYCGIQPFLLLPPASFPLDDRFALFCEKPENLKRDIEKIKAKLRELLYEN
ncbi:hypothetical protein DRN58_05610 [Thermococci archaeon]|uniref:Uncharacterized protein n=1 Tax=Aerophobetes bacterium TaxID=2030807 RepID=A0A7V0N0G8_UNCAE|nr:MAG: hypothetical protein DRN58_05610 [Thermococci archaeon]HDN85071.1 hypothetical protein [Candidatus Aerophobetes bacterium]